MTLDTGVEDRYGEEEPSLFHLIRAAKRRTQRTIQQIYTSDAGMVHTSPDILRGFRDYFTSKYAAIPSEQESTMIILQHVTQQVPRAASVAFECPITQGELYCAIKQGKRGKAPGPDGLAHKFYQTFWGVIHTDLLETMNDMYLGDLTTSSQKHGLIVCLPKHKTAARIEEYPPLTLLNTDFKLLARVIAQRLRPWLPDLISPAQHCGLSGTMIFDALATIREVLAIADIERKSMCVISLDFKGAFDAVSLNFLEAVLLKHGYSATMVRRIMGLYDGATSSVQVNEFISAPIDIRASVRQGCPLSMILYAHVLNPLLSALNTALPGVQIGPRTHPAGNAYADDVTIILTSQAAVPVLCETLTSYEKASWATINKLKSRILGLGNWDISTKILDIPYSDTLTILGTQISRSIKQSSDLSWGKVTTLLKAKAQRDYARRLPFDTRVRYIHEQLYAQVWYLAQISLPPQGRLRELQMSSSRFLWEGEIFRLPLSTLHKPKREGGWNLVNVAAKCRALFFQSIDHWLTQQASLTHTCLGTWNIGSHGSNPP
jgi:hypothetical protein